MSSILLHCYIMIRHLVFGLGSAAIPQTTNPEMRDHAPHFIQAVSISSYQRITI